MPLVIRIRPALGAAAAASVLAICGVCGFLASIHGSMNFRVISRIAFPITAIANPTLNVRQLLGRVGFSHSQLLSLDSYFLCNHIAAVRRKVSVNRLIFGSSERWAHLRVSQGGADD